MQFQVREARETDLIQLLDLYRQLHPDENMTHDNRTDLTWHKILSNPNYIVLVGFVGEKIVSSCHLVIVDNLTHANRPYAIIENVVTDQHFRKKGYATQLLNYAVASARKENCYKVMLMTSSKDARTLHFYEQAGFNLRDKIGFVMWLDR